MFIRINTYCNDTRALMKDTALKINDDCDVMMIKMGLLMEASSIVLEMDTHSSNLLTLYVNGMRWLSR